MLGLLIDGRQLRCRSLLPCCTRTLWTEGVRHDFAVHRVVHCCRDVRVSLSSWRWKEFRATAPSGLSSFSSSYLHQSEGSFPWTQQLGHGLEKPADTTSPYANEIRLDALPLNLGRLLRRSLRQLSSMFGSAPRTVDSHCKRYPQRIQNSAIE